MSSSSGSNAQKRGKIWSSQTKKSCGSASNGNLSSVLVARHPGEFSTGKCSSPFIVWLDYHVSCYKIFVSLVKVPSASHALYNQNAKD